DRSRFFIVGAGGGRIVGEDADGAGVLDDEEARAIARGLQELHRLLEAQGREHALVGQAGHRAGAGAGDGVVAGGVDAAGATGGEQQQRGGGSGGGGAVDGGARA